MEMITEKIDKYLTEKRFKAMDLNKIKNSDGFWDWGYEEAKLAAGLRSLNPKKMSDIIFWLNMASDIWETQQTL